jgi:hypothetical protein
MSGGRYPVLRTLGIFYLLGSAITILAGIAGAAWVAFRAPAAPWDRFSMSLTVLAGTFIAVIAMLFIAEVIKLAIDIEHNTRSTAALLARQLELPTTASSVLAPPPSINHTSRLEPYFHSPDEETAELALLRGH